MLRREWVKMEYTSTPQDQPYVIGTVQELAGVGWALLHCATKTALHDTSPAGVDVGTLVYMRNEGIPFYAVHIADSGKWQVVAREVLEQAQHNPDYRRRGVIMGSRVVRDRIYLPWSKWVELWHPPLWKRVTVADIPYHAETRILENGAVKWRGTDQP